VSVVAVVTELEL